MTVTVIDRFDHSIVIGPVHGRLEGGGQHHAEVRLAVLYRDVPGAPTTVLVFWPGALVSGFTHCVAGHVDR